MRINAIVASTPADVIGNKGDIPWDIPRDMSRFRDITTGHTVVMGRKTWQSLLHKGINHLRGRQNLVLTHSVDIYDCDAVTFINEPMQAMREAQRYGGMGQEIFIIGGSEIYNLFRSLTQRIYHTVTNKYYEGDTVIRPWWWGTSHNLIARDSYNDHTFSIYERL